MNNSEKIKNCFKRILATSVESAGPEGMALQGLALLIEGIPDKIPNIVDDVKEFLEKFGVTYEGRGRLLPLELNVQRDKLIEEFNEWMEATTDRNLNKQHDALLDMMYVIIGLCVMQGIPVYQSWREVHKSNMTKSRYPGKVFGDNIHKGKKYLAPNLSKLLT